MTHNVRSTGPAPDAHPPPAGDLAAPLVDVMISVHGIGPVFSDTVLSLLNQRREGFRLRCLVIVDGCPFLDDVRPVLEDLTQANLFDLNVLYQRNAGVIETRNRAMAQFLQASERADYVLFMDGDDLAAPNLIEASLRALQAAQRAPRAHGTPGWAYADQYQFGDRRSWLQYPPKLWGPRFALNNLSQPSSLIAMGLIEAGVRFDPNFAHGIEDLDFWCSAVGAGFYGVHVPDTVMQYRRLLGSRSSTNRANDAMTKFRLTQKHGYDRYARIATDPETPSRRGWLGASHRAPPPGAPPPVLSLEASDVQRLWSQIRMLGAERHGIVFGTPYVPEILEVETGDRATPLSEDAAFYAEHVFYNDPSLMGLELTETTGTRHFLIAPRRVFSRRDAVVLGRVDLADPTTPLQEISAGLPDWLSAEARAVFEHLRTLLPPSERPARVMCERRWVAHGTANPWHFYRQTLGFVPYLPRDAPESGGKTAWLVGPGLLTQSETIEALRQRLDDVAAQGACVHLVVPSHADRRDVAHPAVAQCHRIFPLIPPTGPDATEHSNPEAGMAYAAGLLSWFDTVVVLQNSPLGDALAWVKARKDVRTSHAPLVSQAASPQDVSDDLYDEIRPPE